MVHGLWRPELVGKYSHRWCSKAVRLLVGYEMLSHELEHKWSTGMERPESRWLEFGLTRFHKENREWTNTFTHRLVNEIEKKLLRDVHSHKKQNEPEIF